MRRTLSIICYVVAGMFLCGEMLIAFLGSGNAPEGAWDMKLGMVGLMLGLALVPLGVGALVSRGRRLREVGITLFTAAIVAAVEFALIAYLMMMPDTGKLFPPGMMDTFDAIGFGLANLLAIGGLGWWLMRRVAAAAAE